MFAVPDADSKQTPPLSSSVKPVSATRVEYATFDVKKSGDRIPSEVKSSMFGSIEPTSALNDKQSFVK